MMNKRENRKTLIFRIAALLGFASTVYYFANLRSMVTSHLEYYLIFPMFLVAAGIVFLVASKIFKSEEWEWNCTLAGIVLLTLAVVCVICSSKINCCSGG